MLQNVYIIFQKVSIIFDSTQNMLNFGLRCSSPLNECNVNNLMIGQMVLNVAPCILKIFFFFFFFLYNETVTCLQSMSKTHHGWICVVFSSKSCVKIHVNVCFLLQNSHRISLDPAGFQRFPLLFPISSLECNSFKLFPFFLIIEHYLGSSI